MDSDLSFVLSSYEIGKESLEGLRVFANLLINTEPRIESRGHMFDEGVIGINILFLIVGLTMLAGRGKLSIFPFLPCSLHSKV